MADPSLLTPLPPVPSGLLHGKVAVVTGGASGIGAAIVDAFIRAGAKVVVADIQYDKAQSLAAQLGAESATAVECNVREEEHIIQAIDMAVETFGGLDIMVNNAGIVGAVGSISQMDTAEFDATLQINLRGVFLGMKHASRVMKARGTRGAIVNMSSVCGMRGGLGFLAYDAAKWGIRGLSESVACQLASSHIRVNCVAPGMVPTAMTGHLMTGTAQADIKSFAEGSPTGESLRPENIASQVLYLASDMSLGVTGYTVLCDNGWLLGIGGIPSPLSALNMPMLHENGRTGINRDAGQWPGAKDAKYHKPDAPATASEQ
ncbi:hypothetical protein WJX72_004353 [[Myrmecia] bisecta]|uniref:Uncharacterized protein n=1 Tax=[Myrmecia] bisecta TaxID=41462 RepID=A0AAW1P9J3_9CHLO